MLGGRNGGTSDDTDTKRENADSGESDSESDDDTDVSKVHRVFMINFRRCSIKNFRYMVCQKNYHLNDRFYH